VRLSGWAPAAGRPGATTLSCAMHGLDHRRLVRLTPPFTNAAVMLWDRRRAGGRRVRYNATCTATESAATSESSRVTAADITTSGHERRTGAQCWAWSVARGQRMHACGVRTARRPRRHPGGVAIDGRCSACSACCAPSRRLVAALATVTATVAVLTAGATTLIISCRRFASTHVDVHPGSDPCTQAQNKDDSYGDRGRRPVRGGHHLRAAAY
jgi:hypothetical protein